MTLTELSYNLLDIIEGGQGTNNEYYSLELMKFQFLYYRALFLRRDATHDADLQHNEQEMTLSMEIIPVAEDRNSAIVADYTSYILRSTEQFPATVAVRGTYDLSFVGTPAYKTIPLARFYQLAHLAYEPFTSCTPRSFTRGRYLYIVNDPGVREIQAAAAGGGAPTTAPLIEAVIRGIFVDPREVSGFDEDSDDFPMSPDLAQRITEGLLKGELTYMRETSTVTDLNIVPDAKEG
jgi:hypothetical protein